MTDAPETPDRFDRWLLDAGFDPSPDSVLVGRAADELAATTDSADDPWAGLASAPALTDDQPRAVGRAARAGARREWRVQ